MMYVSKPEIICLTTPPGLYNTNTKNPNTKCKSSMSIARQNKYFAFDKTIHTTLAEYNKQRFRPEVNLLTLYQLLKDNWVSTGYESLDEEQDFYNRALKLLMNYARNPLDSSYDSLIINKALYSKINQRLALWSKIDRVYENSDNSIEIVDYKTGRVINHKQNFNLDLKTAVYVLLVHNNLNIFPNYVSYYYLSCNKKFTREFHYADLPKIYDFLSSFTQRSNKL